jgi:hypothetical protein
MEGIDYLKDFASRHGLVFDQEGECGFGRQCVGLRHGDNWVSHNPLNSSDYEPIEAMACPEARDLAPPDAYHKHDCLAVLGRGDDAIEQLASWIRELEACGNVRVARYNTGAIGMQAMLSGTHGMALVVDHEEQS